jgi:hypothetical protein
MLNVLNPVLTVCLWGFSVVLFWSVLVYEPVICNHNSSNLLKILDKICFNMLPLFSGLYIVFCLVGFQMYIPWVFTILGVCYLLLNCLTREFITVFYRLIYVSLGIVLVLKSLINMKLI